MYNHPWHNSIAAILARLPAESLLNSGCYFGGGTALVLQSVEQKWGLGAEYRLSNDIDFLATQEAFLALRRKIVENGVDVLVGDLTPAREVRYSDRAIRTALTSPTGEVVKFEVVCDGYQYKHAPGAIIHGITCLGLAQSAANKFTANADRWADRDIALRDYIDLIAMSTSPGGFPVEGLEVAERAYGTKTIVESIQKAHLLLGTQDNIERFGNHLKLSPAVMENLRTFAQVAPEQALGKLVGGLIFA